MENISQIISSKRSPLTIEIFPYLYDHQIEGRAVFPAVEALITLAKAIKKNVPQAQFNTLTDAFFPRFLVIPPGIKTLPAFADIKADGKGGFSTVLQTTLKSKAGNISRTVEHARVHFADSELIPNARHPFPSIEKLQGECINIPAGAVYDECIPFGKTYQNITGDLSVSPEGALAWLSGGNAEADDELLGSPFPLDAALHTACVWAQRFTGVMSFPTGFAKRKIYQKTALGKNYLGRIVPIKFDAEPFIFDAWIFDLRGVVCESIQGIQMRDATGGRMKPPQWIVKNC